MVRIADTSDGTEDEVIGLKPDIQPNIHAILESNHDVIYYADSKGVTQRVSRACKELWGLEPKCLVGRSVFDLERDGIYKPSVTRMVLETGRRVQSLQVTRTGKKLLVVGTPIENESGGIANVVNLSWNLTPDAAPSADENNIGRLLNVYGRAMGDVFAGGAPNRLIYASESMAYVAGVALKVSGVDSTVLITGESGTGKEVVASLIHSQSLRKEKPFIKINCAAIPEQLLESELFGYEKGAFTGANREGKPGVFELAEKGTLFLDEISDMPPSMQVKLLRVLQERTFTRVGGTRDVTADVRIVAATNKNLEAEIREGRFRQDLFYRLNVVPIHIPPLRERPDDVPLLALFFLRHYNERYNKNKIFDARTLLRFQEHNWPGNVRELHNIVERLAVLTDGDVLVPSGLQGGMGASFIKEAEDGVTVHRIMTLKDAVDSVERQLIHMAMKKFGSMTKTADALEVDQSTISRKLKKNA